MIGRAPAFQLYVNDWLGSTKIALMTPAQEGAYVRLLCHAWNDPDCSIPDNDDELAILSRLGEGWFTGGSVAVRRCFEPHPEKPGRLVNLRQLEERKKQDEWRRKSSEGGRKSGDARRNLNKSNGLSGLKGGSRVVEPNANQKATLLSSSSSSSSTMEETRAGFSPSPVYEALEEIYPGSATNFRTMRELFDLAERLHATPEQVRNFPAWLAEKHPRKSDGPYAFRDLFPQSLKNGNGHHATPAKVPTHKCPKCKDLGVFTQNGQMVRCDCWQKEAA